MKVVAFMATCGRHKLAERSLRFFLDQDYPEDHTLLIYNNSSVKINGLRVEEDVPEHKHVILINQNIDSKTGKQYDNLGAIYNDILIAEKAMVKADIITHWDDDDIFLPNHISAGAGNLILSKLDLGYGPGKYKAYKPAQSYYRHPGGVELMNNTLEPSMFVDAKHIHEYGYSLETTPQHLQWVNPLVSKGEIFVDPKGTPTLIYNWGDTDIPTFKTSGDPNNQKNFENYRNFSQDHGDMVLTPWSKDKVEKYYKLVT
jgi:hypothetical protein